MILRRKVLPADCRAVRDIVCSTGFFSPEEEDVAEELVRTHLEQGPASGYHFLFAQDEDGSVLGYTCFGPICCTQGSFDLYWIAVAKNAQQHGLGRLLLTETENIISELSGRAVYIETSGKELYTPTQAFYRKAGYELEAVLKDFYAPGDSKYIYSKQL